ncbi:MAG: valine--tRNA ligase [Candidatus Portnoybacteria bacterium CG10_big_fil_rev_8_21_14_0_10_38_18]|uniref:Valine--tRNA ligase n=1 Tax=Candidatus Portnoybacteria bacterium CG10_big_fil_rev_8_21_14_0_10_38_18 TaxID=1974813 RepID=A0A2M8KCF1_9BACT|nr:MAG: valine--tRNA ligase [Candidatus Portnoybacteria bacterium CG10_big_fil_rev_8_21_14_0_10_38_18]
MTEIPKTYEPKQIEDKIYNLWEKGDFFKPAKSRKKPFVVAIPPPNITGILHIGHALNNTIQDAIIRYHRMTGVPTLWIPGTDHAGIATQNVVEKELKKEGLTRHSLGREKFVKMVWQWKEKYGNLILDQLKKLGCSCDWSRTRFTLDKGYVKAVETAFLHYYKKGWIYQGPRIVNWCPRCSTAISDIEVEYIPHKTKLWYIRYPLKLKSKNEKVKNYITVATTRPETMLGDTAVAVSPKDKRYKNLVGKTVILPLMNRSIPIIADRLVDAGFGTGAVKITPAHDAVDNKIGKIHKLEVINVIGENGKMTKEAGKYAGLSVIDARNKIIEDLKKQNLLQKEEKYEHSLATCVRCHTPIEPLISKQWFLKMDKLAKPAIRVVKENKIKFIPTRYKKVYLDWMKNVEDWCISRQLWWGHKIPIKGSTDVLDTWFSSALWPFATLGWPEKTKDFKTFYPTTLLVTDRGIIFLWVARMIFSSLELCKKNPFKDVYIHATIFTLEGKRMSKSLGTGVDPLLLIEKYGADATRFGLLYLTSRDQQAMKFSEDAIRASRNFANKLWNINRFITMNLKNSNFKIQISNKIQISKSKYQNLTLADKWILSRLNTIIKEITQKIENYQLGEAARQLYDWTWHEYADWYLEISKLKVKSQKSKVNLNPCIFRTILQLLHPFMPFITEYIWQLNYPKEKALIVSGWPKTDKKFINEKTEKEFEKIRNQIIETRKKDPKQNFKDLIQKFLKT